MTPVHFRPRKWYTIIGSSSLVVGAIGTVFSFFVPYSTSLLIVDIIHGLSLFFLVVGCTSLITRKVK
jgi:hypothetical protein